MLIIIVTLGKAGDKCKARSDERSRSKFCEKKCMIFTIIGSILLIVTLLRLVFLIIFVNNNPG